MAQQYDLAIIGSGTAASVVATRVRAAGWRVAVIDCRPLGGTCSLRGCDPKKVLVEAAAAVDHARRMAGKGIAGEHNINWQHLMAFKNGFTDPVSERKERAFTEQGIESFHGTARFVGANSLAVGGQTINARHILIAIGAEPVRLGIPGEELLATNEDFLALKELPRRVLLVGGGYIAAEFSHIAAHAGATVTVLQRGERMLKQFDSQLVEWLMPAFAAAGIAVHIGTSVEAIEKSGGAYRVIASTAGKQTAFEADLVVHAGGRRPEFEALNLPAANLQLEKGRLSLNDYLQSTSNPAVFAAGDAAGVGPPLTPVASHDAKVVAANLLQGPHSKPDYRAVPSVAFSIPPIAAVGLSEAAARDQNLQFRVNCQNTTGWFSARHVAQPVYGYKVLIEDDTERLLGAHLVGPGVAEVINVFALAMRQGMSASDLKSTMFAYPTGASDLASML